MLSATGLLKAYGSLRAVDGVDLEVAQGSITGLIGPNGAGKSTLFDLLAGAQRPGAGEIRLRGERIDGETPDRIFHRGLARTFQVPRPFPQMTVVENLMLVPPSQAGERFWNNWLPGGRIAAEERSVRARAQDVLDLCALADKAGELAGRLSGGQQKLLELARVLMIDPRLILLDEPAAGVNPALLETLIERILLLNRRGISFLIIEHNMDLVMGICDPIVVMAQGRVIYRGDAAGARRDPRVLDAYLGDLV
ncbi:MAG: ABC transporter ATP-binding protein [Betaproteobacteria bacterium]|nr:ABC transporter ATP-binding protein [Betaproteobacteria bacterium]MBM3384544.1 ABC transporter ATP-binding protein [Betaproteobacteria bacterium]